MATWNDAVPTAANQILPDITAVRQNIDELESVLENLSGLALGTDEPSAWVVLGSKISGLSDFVNNADGSPTVSSTSFDIIGTVTVDTKESIGPTGSGADHVWTALDSVTAGSNWIEINLNVRVNGTTGAATDYYFTLQACKNGGTLAQIYRLLFNPGYTTTGIPGHAAMGVVKIPIDSNRIFQVQWGEGASSTTATGSCTLVGFGLNT